MSGNFDHFGYGPGGEDHETYQIDDYANMNSIPFPLHASDTDIDLDLKDVDGSMASAGWSSTVNGETCMIFISAATGTAYDGTTIKPTYNNFKTVIGVLVGGATSIPGLTTGTNVVTADSLNDSDAENVVNTLLGLLLSL